MVTPTYPGHYNYQPALPILTSSTDLSLFPLNRWVWLQYHPYLSPWTIYATHFKPGERAPWYLHREVERYVGTTLEHVFTTFIKTIQIKIKLATNLVSSQWIPIWPGYHHQMLKHIKYENTQCMQLQYKIPSRSNLKRPRNFIIFTCTGVNIQMITNHPLISVLISFICMNTNTGYTYTIHDANIIKK